MQRALEEAQMNIIEQAAKRIEELRRSGVDVPWTANGVETPSPSVDVAPVVAVESVAPQVSAAQAPKQETHADRTVRRSRSVTLDLARLARSGYLVPGSERSQMESEYRIIKRPLLKNASGDSAGPIDRANLIMVTSALPGEGKTFSAINLAMSIAMELDHTVLLVDSDVVRPSVLERLGLQPTKGLLDVLTNPGMDLSEVLLKTNIPKLTVLPAGTSHDRTTELLASASMVDLLDELATLYSDRIVIFDAPPLLPSTESRVLATHMGQVVIVVEAAKTPRSSVNQAFATLEACPVVMAMLNKCRGKVANSAYGYYAV
jgi:protein-tyrosine kinase